MPGRGPRVLVLYFLRRTDVQRYVVTAQGLSVCRLPSTNVVPNLEEEPSGEEHRGVWIRMRLVCCTCAEYPLQYVLHFIRIIPC